MWDREPYWGVQGPDAEEIPWGAPPMDETARLLSGRNGDRLLATVAAFCPVLDATEEEG